MLRPYVFTPARPSVLPAHLARRSPVPRRSSSSRPRTCARSSAAERTAPSRHALSCRAASRRRAPPPLPTPADRAAGCSAPAAAARGPRCLPRRSPALPRDAPRTPCQLRPPHRAAWRSEEHTSELQSRPHLVCRLLLEKKKPVFVDVTLPSYELDVSMLEAARSPRTRAVMAAHTLGNPFDLVF